MKHFFFSIFISVLFLSPALASADPYSDPKKDTTKPLSPLELEDIVLTDDPFVAELDSLMSVALFNSVGLDSNDFASVSEDSILLTSDLHDTIFRDRLELLNQQSPFDLSYNPYVKRYIDTYINRRQNQVSRMMGMANYYFPMFEEALDQYSLPLELKYLAVVESALNPSARSRVGAQGLWQFMYATGRMNGLKVSSYVDERNDPIKATHAACRYLETLYGIFGNWELALAAYNSGPGNVNKAIRRSGGKRNYWEIRAFLPRETQGYVPAFIAVNYVMTYAPEHNIYPKEIKESYWKMDTIAIKEKISFEQITSLTDISMEELVFLNPAYRLKIVPKVPGDYCQLIVPSSKLGVFIANEDSIYKIATQDFKEKKVSSPAYVEMNQRMYHKVRSGEVLGTIAEKYGISVSSLKRWNGLKSNNIRVGQKLAVYPNKLPKNNVASNSKPIKPQAPKTPAKPGQGPYQIYQVKNGDSFYSIAKNYPGVSADNIMNWNGIDNARKLKIGMTLKIYQSS